MEEEFTVRGEKQRKGERLKMGREWHCMEAKCGAPNGIAVDRKAGVGGAMSLKDMQSIE